MYVCMYVCTSDGEDVPDHWYKMAAFDAAADFGKNLDIPLTC